MIGYTPRAERQVDDLRIHYEKKDRLEASRNLDFALEEAEARITAEPEAGLPAPRPYPKLKRRGRAWIKSGSYWIAYSVTTPPIIIGVFYDAADIPGRL